MTRRIPKPLVALTILFAAATSASFLLRYDRMTVLIGISGLTIISTLLIHELRDTVPVIVAGRYAGRVNPNRFLRHIRRDGGTDHKTIEEFEADGTEEFLRQRND